MLEAYRDRHVEHIAAHLSLLVFLKEQEVDQELILHTLHDIRQLGPKYFFCFLVFVECTSRTVSNFNFMSLNLLPVWKIFFSFALNKFDN
jgi:hypothetical protein